MHVIYKHHLLKSLPLTMATLHALTVFSVLSLWFAGNIYADVIRVLVPFPGVTTLAALLCASALSLGLIFTGRLFMGPRHKATILEYQWYWQIPVTAGCLVMFLVTDHISLTMVDPLINRSFHAFTPTLVVIASRFLEKKRYAWRYHLSIYAVQLPLGLITLPVFFQYNPSLWIGGAMCYASVIFSAGWIVMMSRMLSQGWHAAQIVFTTTLVGAFMFAPSVVILEGQDIWDVITQQKYTTEMLTWMTVHTVVYTLYLVLFCAALVFTHSIHLAVLQNVGIFLILTVTFVLAGVYEISYYLACLFIVMLFFPVYGFVSAVTPMRIQGNVGRPRPKSGIRIAVSSHGTNDPKKAFLSDVELQQRMNWSDDEESKF